MISRDGEDLLLEVDAERQAEFIKKMMMYRLRRPVSITPDDQAVRVVFDDADTTGLADPRFGSLAADIMATEMTRTAMTAIIRLSVIVMEWRKAA